MLNFEFSILNWRSAVKRGGADRAKRPGSASSLPSAGVGEGPGRGARVLLAAIGLLAIVLPASPVAAQSLADCGVVDEIVLPIDGIRDGDDFGLYRAKFGGLHVGVDVAFYRHGAPVRAIANGRVTYANPEGWDTEKGVVIVEHNLPDGSRVYSLYGHMEPIGDYFFPGVGQCVKPGQIVGAVGDPSLSAPHLHFEIRVMLPDDGGPGYWDTNPLEAGWLHPIDFVRLWQLRLAGNDEGAASPYISHVTGLHVSSVPPIVAAEGGLIVADGATLEGTTQADATPLGSLAWRMELSSVVTGMLALPDGRLAVRTADNSVSVIRDGRYEAVWTPELALTGAPVLIDAPAADGGTTTALAFFTDQGAVAAYSPAGALLWTTPPLGGQLNSIATAAGRIAIGTRPVSETATPAFHLIDSSGRLLYQVAPANPPLVAFGPRGDYYLLDGPTLYHIAADLVPAALTRLPHPPGRSTTLLADRGGIFVFLGLEEGLLYAYELDGAPRWQLSLPGTHRQPPLLAAGGCLLYALGADGALFALDLQTGALLGQTQLYAGGSSGQPNARLLEVLPGPEGGEWVRFSAGFLSVVTLDGYALAGMAPASCTAG